MPNGFVVSDLHLFTNRVETKAAMMELHDAAADASLFVLNGDIFDFRWSSHPSLDATAMAACDWMESLTAEFPKCTFHYILGNHDAVAPFVEDLRELDRRVTNFAWHPSHVRIGHALFLHGDLPLAPGRNDPLVRKLHDSVGNHRRWRHESYRLFVAARGPRAVVALNRPGRCARRIYESLLQHHPSLLSGVTDIYFGHTHHPFRDFNYRGIRFHNTGSAIRGLKRHILPFEVANDDLRHEPVEA